MIATRFDNYELTNERLKHSCGVFSRSVEVLELYRIKDMKQELPLHFRLFGLGRILLETSDRSTPTVVLNAIHRSNEVADLIRSATWRRSATKSVSVRSTSRRRGRADGLIIPASVDEGSWRCRDGRLPESFPWPRGSSGEGALVIEAEVESDRPGGPVRRDQIVPGRVEALPDEVTHRRLPSKRRKTRVNCRSKGGRGPRARPW